MQCFEHDRSFWSGEGGLLFCWAKRVQYGLTAVSEHVFRAAEQSFASRANELEPASTTIMEQATLGLFQVVAL